MSDMLVSRRYGKALYAICLQKGFLDSVEKELIYFTSILNSNNELQRVLLSPRISSFKKKEIVYAVFGSNMSQITFNFISLLIDKKREKLFQDISTVFSEIILENSNVVVAKVISAFPLSISEQKSIEEAISNLTGKYIKLEVEIDSDIIGGIIIRVEDKVYDGSLTTHLKILENNMAGMI